VFVQAYAILVLDCWQVLRAVGAGSTIAQHDSISSGHSVAIADWSGSLVIILGTKFFYEVGSAESRPVRGHKRSKAAEFLREHSLLIFIGVTGIGWAVLFWRMNPESKWGQVVGNIVSEWGQMAGLVFLTKELVETGSKESQP
jgi:hypothetical protein